MASTHVHPSAHVANVANVARALNLVLRNHDQRIPLAPLGALFPESQDDYPAETVDERYSWLRIRRATRR